MGIFRKRIRDKPEVRSSELDEFIRGEDLHGGVNSGVRAPNYQLCFSPACGE
ncbi:MAG: hypothetical protein R3Y32_00900 [Bacillota bacterium]